MSARIRVRRSVKLALWSWGLIIPAMGLFFIPGYNGAWLLVTCALCGAGFGFAIWSFNIAEQERKHRETYR